MHSDKILLLCLVKYCSTRSLYNKIKKHYPYLIVKINNYYNNNKKLIKYNMGFIEKMYCYIYDLKDRPTCINCNNTVKRFYSFAQGYAIFCCNKCLANDKTIQLQRKKTLFDKYNIDNFFKLFKRNNKK